MRKSVLHNLHAARKAMTIAILYFGFTVPNMILMVYLASNIVWTGEPNGITGSICSPCEIRGLQACTLEHWVVVPRTRSLFYPNGHGSMRRNLGPSGPQSMGRACQNRSFTQWRARFITGCKHPPIDVGDTSQGKRTRSPLSSVLNYTYFQNPKRGHYCKY